MNTVTAAKTLASLPLAVLLSACGSGSLAPPATSTIDSSTTTTFANIPSNTQLTVTPRAGLEAMTVSGGTASLPTVTIQASPTAGYLKAGTGFNLTLPNGKLVSYQTAAGSVGLTPGTQRFSLPDQSNTSQVATNLTRGVTSTLTYSTYGIWRESSLATSALQSLGAFATGIPTVASQRPTTGTGAFTGFANGFVVTATAAAEITGAVSLTADFAANTISGSVTGVTTAAFGTNAAGRLNDITLSAGRITGNSFTGIAAPGAAVAETTTINVTGATGAFGGSFYGPSAAEVAGSLSLSGGGASVIAAFGARR